VDVLPFRALRPSARGPALAALTRPGADALSRFSSQPSRRAARGRGDGTGSPGPTAPGGRGAHPIAAAKQGALAEEKEGLYVYRQEFRTDTGLDKNRMGLIAVLDVEGDPEGGVFPGQETEPFGVEARIEEISASGLQASPVVAGFEDTKFELEKILERAVLARKTPDVDLDAGGGERHLIWKVDDAKRIEDLRRFFRGKDCCLIDGLHGYRALRRLRDASGSGGKAAPLHPMTVLFNLFDFGLVLRAACLLVKEVSGFNVNDLVLRLDASFEVKAYPFSGKSLPRALTEFREDLRLKGFTEMVVGAVFRGVDQFFLFELRDEQARESVYLPDVKEPLREFESVLLRRVVIERYLSGRPGDPFPAIDYSWSTEEAIAAVRAGEFLAAFFINPPNKRKLAALARGGLQLPPGSARLDPPPRAGLLLREVFP